MESQDQRRLVGSLILIMSIMMTLRRAAGDNCRFKLYSESRPADTPEEKSYALFSATGHFPHSVDKEHAVNQNPVAGKALSPDLGTNLQASNIHQDAPVSSSDFQVETNGAGLLTPSLDLWSGSSAPGEEQRLGSSLGRETGSYGVTNLTYRGLVISIPRRFSRYSELLLRNQMTAIDQGSVYNVNTPTRTYIVGWLNSAPKMVCVHVAVPDTTWEDVEKIPCIPVCMVERDGSMVAALVLMSIGACWRLPEKKSKQVDLFGLEDSYREVLESASFGEGKPC